MAHDRPPVQLPLPADFACVHGPLAHWAAVHPQRTALCNGQEGLSFAALHTAVQAKAAALQRAQAPATVLLDSSGRTLDAVVDFLAVVASGRCAAVADPDWPAPVRQAVQDRLPAPEACSTPPPQADTSFYVGFTSGSTGLPKGFRRDHGSWSESFRVSLQDFGPAAAGRVLAPGRMSHSLFLFGMLLGLWTGAGVEVQERFSAPQALATLAAGATPVLVAVPSQLVLMLEQARRRQLPPVPGVQLVLISGARWMRQHTPALQALFPQARIVEFYGASEASYIAWMEADAHAPPQAVGRPFSNVQLQIRPPAGGVPLPAGQAGQIWLRSPMLFRDYVGATDGTAALRDGDWLSVRDMGYLDAQGLLHLCGRENRMLVTQGKNLFPEEVEARLAAHPAVAQAALLGVEDGLRGQRVHAVLQPPAGQDLPDAATLQTWGRATLEAFKLPRHWWLWTGAWPLTASGKTDHPALLHALQQALQAPDTPEPADLPLRPWP